MPADDHLGQQWFHGTTEEFAPGDVVHPAAKVGKHGEPGSLEEAANPHHAFAAKDLGEAHMWAGMRGGGKVYKVEPLDDIEEFKSPEGYTYGRSSAGFKVVGAAGPNPVSRDDAVHHTNAIKRQEEIRQQRRSRSSELAVQRTPGLADALERLSSVLLDRRRVL